MDQFQLLLQRFHDKTATSEEVEELFTLLRAKGGEESFEGHFALMLANNEPLSQDDQLYWTDRLAGFKSRVVHTRSQRPVHRVHFLKTAWFRYAAAIVVVVGLATAGYVVLKSDTERNQADQINPVNQAQDILPGSNKAILTLSDGRRVELDSASSGTINDQNLSIENKNGQLQYGSSSVTAYNTMTTPAGGQYQVVLPDGTRVWLNAMSSITYPTAFVGDKREVSMTGEAYFEVKKNPSKPFVVNTVTDTIEVLGTEFNINAYSNEIAVKTTLVNGSVNVNDTNIKPGQAFRKGKIIQTNASQDTEWRNGRFDFNDMDVRSAMRQISRWYDVTIKYEGDVPTYKLGGMLGRDLTLQQILRSLSGIGVKTILNGNTVTVLSVE